MNTAGLTLVLPAHTIVARNSFVNKDYSSEGEYRMLAGIPAKVHGGHVQRIFNWDMEHSYDKMFSDYKTEFVLESPGPVSEPHWSWNNMI